MEYYLSEQDAFLRLEPGEYLIQSLLQFADQEKIDFALIVSGVGMLEGLEMGWFCVNDNDYDTYRIAGTYDLSSISGNIAIFENTHRAHVHITANRPDFSTVSGHLIDCRCHITMEIGLRLLKNSQLERIEVEGIPATFITKTKTPHNADR